MQNLTRSLAALFDKADARDDRVKNILTLAIQDAQIRKQEAEAEIARIRQAATNGFWWELKEYLSQDDIESLCELSPQNLFD